MNLYVNNCLHPQVIYRRKGINPLSGKHFPAAKSEDLSKWTAASFEELPVRCGKCINCLKAKSRSLVARCVAESRMHSGSAFITLTVSDKFLDDVFPGRSLIHRPFQLFFKRLRKRCGDGIKYMMCGEYGELHERPHYHAIVFGVPAFLWLDSCIPDYRGFGNYKRRVDNTVFQVSWPYGEVYVGDVSPASTAYVCGYTCKQFVLGRDDDWYKSRGLNPEYVKWSRKPGLGRSYFEKYGLDLVSSDESSSGVEIDGLRWYAGRYFSDWLRLTYPDEYDKLLSSYETVSGDRLREVEAVTQEIDRIGRSTSCYQFNLSHRRRN